MTTGSNGEKTWPIAVPIIVLAALAALLTAGLLAIAPMVEAVTRDPDLATRDQPPGPIVLPRVGTRAAISWVDTAGN